MTEKDFERMIDNMKDGLENGNYKILNYGLTGRSEEPLQECSSEGSEEPSEEQEEQK